MSDYVGNCPNCGSSVICVSDGKYGPYLRCKRDYKCWHKSISNEDCNLYDNYNPEVIQKMRCQVEDNDCDSPNLDDSDFF
jgi:topoisomerase IA-like protein